MAFGKIYGYTYAKLMRWMTTMWQLQDEIPILYHPTTLLLVDDDESLLASLDLFLSDSFSCFTTQSPIAALAYLTHNSYCDTDLDIITLNGNNFSVRHSLAHFSVDFAQLLKHYHQPHHQQKVAVAIIDKTMPEMDGLALCQKMRTLKNHVQTILLTGTTDRSQAINAFNDNIIDKYIAKDNIQIIYEQLRNTVYELTWRYFTELSKRIITPIQHQLPLLETETFKSVFFKIYQQQQIIEHYLIDSYGSFLLIDANRQYFLLLLRNRAYFEELRELAQSSGAATDIVAKFAQQQAIPFASDSKIELSLEGQAWANTTLIATTRLDEQHVYALIPVSDTFIGQIGHTTDEAIT